MSRKARTRAAVAALLALVAGGILAFGQISGTFAIFSAETEDQSNVAQGSWIPAPGGTSSAVPTASPYGTIGLSWTSGASAAAPSPNPVTGQTLMYADGGSGSSASCGSYSTFSTVTAGTTSANVTGTNTGDWWCFEVESTSASGSTSGSWTSAPVAFAPLQIFVATGLAQNDGGGNSNVFQTNDTIVLRFNQNATLSGQIRVRACKNQDTILISNAGILSCSATPKIGTITGQSVATNEQCNNGTVAGSGSQTLTITIKGCGSTSAIGSGTATFTPTDPNAITSANGAPLCVSTGSPDCTPSTTGRY